MLGLTKSTNLTEVQKADLIGQYIGETEKVTKAVIRNSKRGVLFVDEAYRLTPPDSPKDFGRHALDELMREMDSHDPVMIFAGYQSHMESFFQSNPGLYRRIPFVLKFPNYSKSDLSEIFVSLLKRHQYRVSDDSAIQEAFSYISDSHIAAMNAGLCHILFQKAKDCLIRRITIDKLMSADLDTLINSSEAKASRVIICKFPVKFPFPVHSGLQRASKSRHVHSNRVPGRLAGRSAFNHLRMCQYVFALYILFTLRSVMTTALDSDERLHSEVGLKQERTRQRTYARRR